MSDDDNTATAAHEETPMKIHPAMIAIMRDCTFISKDQKNAQQGFMFRGIDSTYNHLHRIFAKHGVFTTSEILEETRSERQTAKGGTLLFVTLKIRYWFHAEDGSKLPTEVIGEGMDSGDKSTNKAMSIAHKYALLQAMMIPTEDMADPDADNPELGQIEYLTPEQVKELDALLTETGADKARFLKHAKAERLEGIQACYFEDARQAILKAAEARKAAERSRDPA